MKNIFLTTIIVFGSVLLIAQSEVTIGISRARFAQLHPSLEAAIYEDTQTYSIPDTLFGLADEWGYRFEKDSLSWIYFNKYIDDITKENFELCLSSTDKIIAEYTLAFGQPDTVLVGDRNFVDPYEKWHWGYDVVEARWNNANGMKVKVEFDFFGGKGVFNFIVSVNYFDKDYPFFD
jgi:hypothetical protein